MKGFVSGSDKVSIEGTLLSALKAGVVVDLNADGDLNDAGETLGGSAFSTTNEANLDVGTGVVAAYINTSLANTSLTDLSDTGNLLNYLNNNLDTAVSGDSQLFVVQSTTNTGLYFYQENGGDNIIDNSEIRMLAEFDSLLDAGDISSNLFTGGAVVVTPPPPPAGDKAVTVGPNGTDDAAAGNNVTEDASGANVTFTIEDSVTANYTYTIEGFAAGDVLDFEGGFIDPTTVLNTSFTDGNIEVSMTDATTGLKATIDLIGVAADVDGTNFIVDVASFNSVFGAGSLI